MTTAISCPDMDRLRELVQDRLPSEEAEPIQKHLDECEMCREAVARLTETSGSERETPPPQDATMIRPEGVPASSPARSKLAYLAPPERDDEIGRLAHYRILKVLGEGGMGIVFKAEDLHLERVVALKVMKPQANMEEDFEQRFFREARATAALRSDHIVTIFEINKDRGVFFLAMEFLQGESLDNWLARGQRPSVTHTIRIAREIALGLGAAHAKGLIHRDIKPANIWLEQFPVSQPGAPPYRVKILDFGLARKDNDDQHLTQAGYIVGTPAYMAPEQAHGDPVDQRCDLFSLGCVLYHLCGGAQPFQGKTSMAVLAALVSMTPRSLDQVNPNLPKPLVDLVGRLMNKDPNGRPATAQAVVEELNAIERTYKQQGGASSVRAMPERKAGPDKKDINSLGLDDVGLAPLDEPPPPKPVEKPAATVKTPTPPPLPAVKSPTPPPRPAVMQTTVKKKPTLKSDVRPPRETEEPLEFDELEEVSKPRGKDSKTREAITKRKDSERDEKPEKLAKKKKKKQGPPKWIWFAVGGGAALLILILVLVLVSGDGGKAKPKSGTVTINTPDPNIQLILDGDGGETTVDPRSKNTVELKPGAYRVRLASVAPGFELVTKEITLTDGGQGTITIRRTTPVNPPVVVNEQTWLTQTTALPPDPQLDAVIAELKKRNNGFDGKVTPKKTGANVVGLTFSADNVTDLFPLRAIAGLKELDCSGSKPGAGKLADLSRLSGLKLNSLKVSSTKVADLSPLRGMPLQTLTIRQTSVESLEPLRDMKLVTLDFSLTKVSDLSPLQKSTQLKTITLQQTSVTNLKPLEGLPLTRVTITGSKVADLSPLLKSPIDNLTLTWQTQKEVEPLKALKTLKTVNNKPVDQFWKEVAMKK